MFRQTVVLVSFVNALISKVSRLFFKGMNAYNRMIEAIEASDVTKVGARGQIWFKRKKEKIIKQKRACKQILTHQFPAE